jgi:putative protein-disulfide isomerase
MRNESVALLYFFDPLCGWCYAFHPVLDQLVSAHPGWELEYVSGGMVRGASEGPVGVMSDYILGELPRVEEMTGVKFGEGFKAMMREGTRHSSSVPPSRALAVFKNYFPEHVRAFVKELFAAHFDAGNDLNRLETYLDICSNLGVNAELFAQYVADENSLRSASEDFQFTSNCGISGFPALVLKKGEEYFLIAKGYSSFEQVSKVIESIFFGK